MASILQNIKRAETNCKIASDTFALLFFFFFFSTLNFYKIAIV